MGKKRWATRGFTFGSIGNEEITLEDVLASEPAQSDERIEALRRALDRLPAKNRELLQRRIIDGAGIRELAAEYGLAQGKLRQRLSSATEKLRRMVKEEVSMSYKMNQYLILAGVKVPGGPGPQEGGRSVMSENDLWNMLSREDQMVNGRAWSLNVVKSREAEEVLRPDTVGQGDGCSGCSSQ